MENQPHVSPSSSRGFTDYLVILARWRTPIFLTSFIAGLLTAAYVWFLMPNVYESKAAIKSSVISQVSASGIGSMLNAKGVGDIGGILGMGQQRNDLDQYVGVLESELVMSEIVRRHNLQSEYRVKYFDDAVKTFRDQVKFSPNRESQILTIAVQDTSPRRSQQICSQLIELLDSVNKTLSRRNAQSAREYLELRYRQCLQELRLAEDSLRVFQIRYKVYDMKDQATASIKVAAEVEGQIVLKEVQANMMAQSLGADDADTKRLVAEVEELKRQRRQMDSGLDLRTAFQSIIPFGNAPQLGMEYFRRYRDVEIQQKLFALLFPMVEQAKVDEQRNSPSLLVLDSPSLPERKVSPKRSIITLLVIGFTFIVAYLVVLLLENARRFRQNDPIHSAQLYSALNRIFPIGRKRR